ncbi:MAG: exodeoxyribonuclease VII large subunit [Ruminococcaceae bacterium]|nr:exodeoxyribonuclease VII large subunit [Oscillospiraceae bacterium]
MAEIKTITVTQLNNYIKHIIDSDPHLELVSVRGEISNFTAHKTGHFYMTLKDENSLIRAVMFRGNTSRLKFRPENGMKVIVAGRVSAFPRDGQYQIYLEDIQPDGVGALYLAYEQLKAKLAAEGLFDESRKRALPKTPTRVGVVTSPTGAAVRDIINVMGRRFPLAQIILYPSAVQGAEAAPQIAKAVQYFSDTRCVDVLIVGRGGGSIEDLWAFNDENVARTVASCNVPVISAVGHETDFTICDFAADMRAPTPSAAAELAVPSCAELAQKLQNVKTRLVSDVSKKIQVYRQKTQFLASRKVLQNPIYLIEDRRMNVEFLTRRMSAAMALKEKMARERFTRAAAKLDALSPLAVLARGYAIAQTDRKIIKSKNDVSAGDEITVRVADGNIKAITIEQTGDM